MTVIIDEGDDMEGWIKLHRDILKWEWWSDINTFRLFTYMLLKAFWDEGKYRGIVIPRGSFPSSISKMSEDTGLTIQQVRTALKHLQKTSEVTSKTYGKFSVFTVKNYLLYQDDNKEITSNLTSNQHNTQQGINKELTSSQQEDNKLIEKEIKETKEDKESKKVRKVSKGATAPKEPDIYFPNDELLDKTFKEYLDMRKQIKKPATSRAIELAIDKLNKLSNGDNNVAVGILNQSILNNYQGLFPLKEDYSNRTAREPQKTQQQQNLDFLFGVINGGKR